MVSWLDANAYTSWLSKKTGRAYRLLSETEREFAARAGTVTQFWWGNSISPDQANYDYSKRLQSAVKYQLRARNKTVEVDAFSPNPWGLLSVHGNVTEMTSDCWNDSHIGNPSDGSSRLSGDCTFRVTRGGSWGSHPRELRSANRDAINIGERGNNSTGFRVARGVAF
jgi:formylglycine-generating enzyme required for sulfatase activity